VRPPQNSTNVICIMSNSFGIDKSIALAPLHLGLDATAAARPRTGIGHYVGTLLGALSRRADVELWPLTHGLRSTLPLATEGLRRPARLKVPGKLLLLSWHHMGRPSVDGLLPEAQVLWSPNYLVLPTRKPLIVTVHDLYFLDGEGRDYWSGGFLAAHLRRHLERRAALVLTDSEAVRVRLLERFPALEGRAEVLYPGLTEGWRQRAGLEECEAARRALELPRDYLLCIGELSQRKNQLVLLEALRRTPPEKLPPLVLCGLGPESRQRIERRAREVGLAHGQVLTLPYLESARLHRVMSGALGVVCPSLEEGFGLTAVEALALGVPVACSTAGSLPEVTGGLAVYFDPRDSDAAAEALVSIAADEELRRAQASNGPAWTAQFDDAAAARRLIELARGVLGAGRP